jgi:outer membrane lipoprotein-sorting protein
MRRLSIDSFRHRLPAVAGTVAAVLIAADANADPESVRSDAKSAMAQVEAKFGAIKSIRYTAERTLRSAAGSAAEEWSFCYSEPASLRIECRKPVERILVSDGQVFWEYVPSARKAVKTDLAGMQGDSKRQFLAGIISRVSIEGIRVGDCDGMAGRAVTFNRNSLTGAVVRIEGAGPRYVMEIDTEKRVLLRTEVFDAAGQCMARTAASGFTEVSPGFWYPTEVRVDFKTDKGIATSEVRLSAVQANRPLPEDAFKFTVPRGVEVDTSRPAIEPSRIQ